jgi:quercetin dioxygenase-like cupin family protein
MTGAENSMIQDASMASRPRLADRIVRYDDLVPCRNAFIDTRTPGSEAKENFTIIGPGVSENPDQHIHIAEPHGFNIGGARQPPACVNSQHSHDTAETFVVHSGRWRFTFGEDGGDSAIEAETGDIVSFPTNAFRGFENIGEGSGFLWSVLGGDDPGRVLWAPAVFDMARDYGLVLLENGALVDTVAGQSAPDGIAPMPPTSREQVAALDRIGQAQAETLVVRANDRARETDAGAGIARLRIIGAGGHFAWDHGFAVDRLRFEPGSAWTPPAIDAAHVLFVQSGEIGLRVDGDEATLAAGDTVTIPRGAARRVTAATPATLFSVTGGDQ